MLERCSAVRAMNHEVQLRLIGPPVILIDDQVARLPRRKALALLAYLVLQRSAVSRDRLATMLWPDAALVAGRTSLRRALADVNALLGSGWHISGGDEWIAINTTYSIRTDIEVIRQLVRSRAPSREAREFDSWTYAVSGVLLEGHDHGGNGAWEEWLEVERQALKQIQRDLAQQATTASWVSGDVHRALQWTTLWCALDDLDEKAFRAHLEALARIGREEAMAEAMLSFSERLDRELGVEPAPATRALFEQLRSGPSIQETGPSVAILPFSDLSETKDQDYFCEGLVEEILNALCSIQGLRVASRTSSSLFRGGGADLRNVGRVLNVATIVEGSVRIEGERVRVTAQLIDASNGFHLWSSNFERQVQDLFSIQQDIATRIADALCVPLDAPRVMGGRRPSSLRAYEFYLRGRRLQQMKSAMELIAAPTMFRRAIELDDAYAQAYAGLADVLVELSLWGFMKTSDVVDEALAASRRALSINPDLAEAYVAHANIMHLTKDYDAAEKAYQRAITLNPRLYEAHYSFARFLYARGEYALAADEFEAAHRVRPDEYQALTLAVMPAEALGERARAIDLAREALKLALADAEMDPENGRAHYHAACLKLRLGDAEGGKQSVEMALGLRPNDFTTLYNAACFYANLGATDNALDLLDRAVGPGRGYRDFIDSDHDLVVLHEHPRYQAIVSRLS